MAKIKRFAVSAAACLYFGSFTLARAQDQGLPSFDAVKESLSLDQNRAALAAANQIPPAGSGWSISPSADRKTMRLRSADGDSYTVYLYFPKKAAGPLPLVLVTPLPVKHRKSMQSYCEKTIVKDAMACAYLEADASPWEMLDNLKSDDPQSSVAMLTAFRKNILDTISAGELTLDILAADPRVDRNKIAAAGFSLGGIMASLMAQRDDRIKSLALLFSGADLADIVMTKKEGNKKWEASLGRFRAGLAQATGNEDPDHLKEYLENAFADVEPLRGVDDMRDLPTFMANPRKDELIPKTAVDAYRSAMEGSGVLLSSYVVPLDFHVPTKRKILTLMLFHLKSAIDAMHRLDSSGTFLEGHLNEAESRSSPTR